MSASEQPDVNLEQPAGHLSETDDQLLSDALVHAEGPKLKVEIKWKSQTFPLILPHPDQLTVGFLKTMVAVLTNVRPARQKLIVARYKGKLDDVCSVASLGLRDGDRIMLIGNTDDQLATVDQSINQALSVIDDFEDLTIDDDQSSHLINDPSVRRKLKKISETFTITFIAQPRPQKRLLVLDLDYTLFDMKTESSDLRSLKRPFTHRMLRMLYPYYEFVVWSQTSWRWLELKLTELGCLTDPEYQIMFVMDKSTMPSVTSTKKGGEAMKHHCKPLSLIWDKCTQFGSHNTVHIDDLSRNFALNPQSGLKISPFKRALENRKTDIELFTLTQYLYLIKDCDDFRALNHAKYKQFVEEHASNLPDNLITPPPSRFL